MTSLAQTPAKAPAGQLACAIVIPVMNESGNVAPLVDEIAASMNAAGLAAYEVIFVDDGSTDRTVEELTALLPGRPWVRLILHASNHGKSQALRTGIKAARARWIVTIDGDGQNDPADIPRLLAAAWEDGFERDALVCGLRRKRHDTAARRLASRAANAIRAWLLDDDCPDTGCGFKAFPREARLDLPFFEGMHRYEPALFRLYGHPVRMVPINHRPRHGGVSKYTNWGRALVGVFDMLGVMWLQRRTPLVRPAAREIRADGARKADAA